MGGEISTEGRKGHEASVVGNREFFTTAPPRLYSRAGASACGGEVAEVSERKWWRMESPQKMQKGTKKM